MVVSPSCKGWGQKVRVHAMCTKQAIFLTMMLGRVAYLGSFSLRSAVTTAGRLTRTSSNPPSTSLVMLSWEPSLSSLEVKVA